MVDLTNHIVYIYFDGLTDDFLEDYTYWELVSCLGILQAEGYDSVVKMWYTDHEGSFLFDLETHLDLVVNQVGIYES